MVVESTGVLDVSGGVSGGSLESAVLICDTVELKRVVTFLYKSGDRR